MEQTLFGKDISSNEDLNFLKDSQILEGKYADRSWLFEQFPQNLPYSQLLYRGTRDTFKRQALFEKCKGKQSLLTLIKTSEDNIFGGYSAIEWQLDSQQTTKLTDQSMFLFSIDYSTIFKVKKNRITSMIFDPDILFQFGDEGEIVVFEDCNQYFDNFSDYFGSDKTAFEAQKSKQNQEERSEKITKSRYFKVLEVEIFQIDDPYDFKKYLEQVIKENLITLTFEQIKNKLHLQSIEQDNIAFEAYQSQVRAYILESYNKQIHEKPNPQDLETVVNLLKSAKRIKDLSDNKSKLYETDYQVNMTISSEENFVNDIKVEIITYLETTLMIDQMKADNDDYLAIQLRSLFETYEFNFDNSFKEIFQDLNKELFNQSKVDKLAEMCSKVNNLKEYARFFSTFKSNLDQESSKRINELYQSYAKVEIKKDSQSYMKNVILVSKIKEEIRDLLNNNTNVKLIATSWIYIDADLTDQFLKGKNMSIVGSNIKVLNKYTLDVSGNDKTENKPKAKDATQLGEDGEDGVDGVPGQSGGNILIITDNFVNSEFLTIKSFGGSGSKGQDGGDGKEGKNGENGVDAYNYFNAEFYKGMYPDKPILQHILQKLDQVTDQSRSIFWKDIGAFSGGFHLDGYFKNVVHKIHYFYAYWFMTEESFFLMNGTTGTPGQNGGQGGDAGRGGQGGFEGEVTAVNVKNSLKYSINSFGSKGKEGISGEIGKSKPGGLGGKNGFDFGLERVSFHSDVDHKDGHFQRVQDDDGIYDYYDNKRYTLKFNNDYPKYSESGHRARESTVVSKNAIAAVKQEAIVISQVMQIFTEQLKQKGQVNLTQQLLMQLRNQINELKQQIVEQIKSKAKETVKISIDQKLVEEEIQNLEGKDNTEKYINQEKEYSEKTYAPQGKSQFRIDIETFNFEDYGICLDQVILPNDNNNGDDPLFRILVDISKDTKDPLRLRSEFAEHLAKAVKSEKGFLHLVHNGATEQQLMKSVISYIEQAYYLKLQKIEGKSLSVLFGEYKKFKKITEEKWVLFSQKIQGNEAVNKLVNQNKAETESFQEIFCEMMKQNPEKLVSIMNADELKKFQEFKKEDDTEFMFNIKDAYIDEYIQLLRQSSQILQLNDLKLLSEFMQQSFKVFRLLKNYKKQIFEYQFIVPYEISNNKPPIALLLMNNGTTFNRLIPNVKNFYLTKSSSCLKPDRLCRQLLYEMKDYFGYEQLQTDMNFLFETAEERMIQINKYIFTIEVHLLEQERFRNVNKDSFVTSLNDLVFFLRRIQFQNDKDKGDLQYGLDGFLLQILFEILENKEIDVNLDELSWILSNLARLIILNNIQIKDLFEILFRSFVEDFNYTRILKIFIAITFEDYYKDGTLKEIVEIVQKIKSQKLLLTLFTKLTEKKLQNISGSYFTKTLQNISELKENQILVYCEILSETDIEVWNQEISICEIVDYIQKQCIEKKLVLSKDNKERMIYCLQEILRLNGRKITLELINVLFTNTFEDENSFIKTLLKFYTKEWDVNQAIKQLKNILPTEWEAKMQKSDTQRTYQELIELIELDELNNSQIDYSQIKTTMSNIQDILKNKEKEFEQVYPLDNFNKKDQIAQKEDVKKWLDGQNIKEQNFETKLAIMLLVYKKIKNKKGKIESSQEQTPNTANTTNTSDLKDTQILAIVLQIKSSTQNKKGMFQQLKTGEGKTMIIVYTSILKILEKQVTYIDIITSNKVLAMRDATERKQWYDLFGITSGHCCSDNEDDRKIAYQKQVLYGENQGFQRDLLLHEFYAKNIRGQRTTDFLIIDEVDSMFLDKAQNTLYLSHMIPQMNFLEGIYVNIWAMVNSKDATYSKEFIEMIRFTILDMLYGAISKYTFANIEGITAPQIDQIMTILTQSKIIDQNGIIISNFDKQFNFPEDLKKFDFSVKLTLKNQKEKQPFINAPISMRDFIFCSLTEWIKNAFKARSFQEDDEYIIQYKAQFNDVNVTIMENDTGVEQPYSEWSNGLQQFLQLKHARKLTVETLKGVFLSNISFFKRYKNNIFGLTGTIGTQTERDILTQLYDCDYIRIPPFVISKLIQTESILKNKRSSWVEAIYNVTMQIREKRAILIICQNVRQCNQISKVFRSKGVPIVEYIHSDQNVEFDKIKKGTVIIATNLAGRGIDCSVTNTVKENGGLHVVLAYMPTNIRIEEQAFGRTARKGNLGTAQFILQDDSLVDDSDQLKNEKIIQKLKYRRDFHEHERVTKIKDSYYLHLKIEEELFDSFRDKYIALDKEITQADYTREHADIILQSALNLWAFWLNYHEKQIFDIANENDKNTVREQFKIYLEQKMTMKSLIDLTSEASILIKQGNYFFKKKEYQKALTYYQQVINQNKELLFEAYYFAGACQINLDKCDEGKSMLIKSKLLLKSQMNEQMSLIPQVSMSNVYRVEGSELTSQQNQFQAQKQECLQVYQLIINTIDMIYGQEVEPSDFVSDNLDEEGAKQLLKDIYQHTNIFKKNKVHSNFNKDTNLNLPDSFTNFQSDIKDILISNKDKTISEELFDSVLPNKQQFITFMKNNQLISDPIEVYTFNLEQVSKNILFNLSEVEAIQKKTIKSPSTFILKQDLAEILKENQLTQSIQNKVFQLEYAYRFIEDKIKEAPSLLKKLSKFNKINKDTFNHLLGMNSNQKQSEEIFQSLQKASIIDNEGYLISYSFEAFKEALSEQYLHPVITSLFEESCLYSMNYFEEINIMQVSKQFIVLEQDINIPTKLSEMLYYHLYLENIIENEYQVDFEKIENLKTEYDKLIAAKTSNEAYKKNKDQYIKMLESKKGKFLSLVEDGNTPQSIFKEFSDLLSQKDNYKLQMALSNFQANGFSNTLDVNPKKYTLKTILSIIGVAILGIAEIAAGCLIEVFTLGAGSYLAGILIGEGVGDIMYSIQAAYEGTFSWSAYLIQKGISLSISIISAGVGAYLSRGTQVSRIGLSIGKKIGNPSLFLKVAGKDLISQVGYKAVAKQVFKNIGEKAITSIAFGLANIGIESLINNFFSALLKNLNETIQTSAKEAFKQSKLGEKFQNLAQSIGVEQAKLTIQNKGQQLLKDNSIENVILISSLGQTLADSIIANIQQANINAILSDNNKLKLLAETAQIVGYLIKSVNLVLIGYEILKVDTSFIQSLEQEFDKYSSNSSNKFQERLEQGYIDSTINEWIDNLSNKMVSILQQQFVSLLQQGVQTILVHFIEKAKSVIDEMQYRQQKKQQEVQQLIRTLNENNIIIERQINEQIANEHSLNRQSSLNPPLSEKAISVHKEVTQYMVERFSTDIENYRLGCEYTTSKLCQILNKNVVIEDESGEHISAFNSQGEQIFKKEEISTIQIDENTLILRSKLQEDGYTHYYPKNNEGLTKGEITDCLYKSILYASNLSHEKEDIVKIRKEVAKLVRNDPSAWTIIKNCAPDLTISYKLLKEGGGAQAQTIIDQVIQSQTKEIKDEKWIELKTFLEGKTGEKNQVSEYTIKGLIEVDTFPGKSSNYNIEDQNGKKITNTNEILLNITVDQKFKEAQISNRVIGFEDAIVKQSKKNEVFFNLIENKLYDYSLTEQLLKKYDPKRNFHLNIDWFKQILSYYVRKNLITSEQERMLQKSYQLCYEDQSVFIKKYRAYIERTERWLQDQEDLKDSAKIIVSHSGIQQNIMENGEVPVAIGSKRPVYIIIKLDRVNKYNILVEINANKKDIFKMSKTSFIFEAGDLQNVITGIQIDLQLYESVKADDKVEINISQNSKMKSSIHYKIQKPGSRIIQILEQFVLDDEAKKINKNDSEDETHNFPASEADQEDAYKEQEDEEELEDKIQEDEEQHDKEQEDKDKDPMQMTERRINYLLKLDEFNNSQNLREINSNQMLSFKEVIIKQEEQYIDLVHDNIIMLQIKEFKNVQKFNFVAKIKVSLNQIPDIDEQILIKIVPDNKKQPSKDKKYLININKDKLVFEACTYDRVYQLDIDVLVQLDAVFNNAETPFLVQMYSNKDDSLREESLIFKIDTEFNIRVRMLQAGKGDCFHLRGQKVKHIKEWVLNQTDNKYYLKVQSYEEKQENILIDSGNYSSTNNYYCFKNVRLRSLEKIDLIIITHFDEDHISGVAALLKLKQNDPNFIKKFFKKVFLPIKTADFTQIVGGTSKLKRYQTILNNLLPNQTGIIDQMPWNNKRSLNLSSGENFSYNLLELFDLTFHNPRKDVFNNLKYAQNGVTLNDISVVTTITAKYYVPYVKHASGKFEKFRALFTGDANDNTNELSTIRGTDQKNYHYSLLKVTHHGTITSTDQKFYQLISADHYFISGLSSQSSKKYHPNKQILEYIVSSNQNAKLYLTFTAVCPQNEPNNITSNAVIYKLKNDQYEIDCILNKSVHDSELSFTNLQLIKSSSQNNIWPKIQKK